MGLVLMPFFFDMNFTIEMLCTTPDQSRANEST